MDSYSCTYVEAERKLLASKMSFGEYAVLRYLTTRADELGRCWPSQDTIAADVGLRRETVNRYLSALEDAGLIRYLQRAGRDLVTGQRTTAVYMVSPEYYHVRPELQGDAYSLWNRSVIGEPRVICTSHQPTTEPAPRTSDSNQRQEPTTTTSDFRYAVDDFDRERYDQMREGKDDGEAVQQAQAEKQKTAAITQSPENPQQATFKDQGSAPLVKNGTHAKPRIHQYPALESIREVMPDAAKETLAARVRDEAQMPLPLARGLIQSYGGTPVEAILNSGALAKAEKPGGLLRYLLHTGAVTSPGDAPVKTKSDASRYAAGEFADYLNY